MTHTVTRRVTVERRVLGGQEQPGHRHFQTGKAETKAARVVKEFDPWRSEWLDTDEEAMCRSIGSPTDGTRSTASEIGKPGRIQEQMIRQLKSFKSGGFGANAVHAEMVERIGLTIDSGCAASRCCICRWDARFESRSSRIHCCTP